jgi:hypothetical protein
MKCRCGGKMRLIRYEVENEGKANERTLKVYQCQDCGTEEKYPG